jgi:nickel-dependent lactate racemase
MVLMRVDVPYGDTTLSFDLEGEVAVLQPNREAPSEVPAQLVRRALSQPVGSPPLRDLARGRRSAMILIACRTRCTGSEVFVPLLADALNEAGIPDERITVCTATGSHDNFRAEDAPLLLGSAAGRVRFTGHDCVTGNQLVEVGTTSRGTRVRLSRQYLDADLKIATGRVTFHYFAGFSGGRKAVLPGVSAKDTIIANHSMAVLREGGVRLNPDTRNGNLDTNPIHLDMLEAARFAPPDFTLTTVLNTRHEITHVFGGAMEASHLAGVEIVRRLDAPRLSVPADWIIASSGGMPYDGNTIQAVKALFNCFHCVRPGGVFILVAECPERGPRWLVESAAIASRQELDRRIRDRSVIQAHNVLWLREARERAHVIMLTSLPEADIRALGFHPARTAAQAVALARQLAGKPGRVVIVPYGNITFPELLTGGQHEGRES